MTKQKTESEKLWNYLRKKVNNTKTAKEIFNRVYKKNKPHEIHIQYKMDTKPLMQSLKLTKLITKELSKIKIGK